MIRSEYRLTFERRNEGATSNEWGNRKSKNSIILLEYKGIEGRKEGRGERKVGLSDGRWRGSAIDGQDREQHRAP